MSQPLLFDDIECDAILSEDRVYRYRLTRIWDRYRPLTNFIMLNPSTADEVNPDPTITRCVNFARSWNHGGIVVTNLFAFRATEPGELAEVADPCGPDNEEHIVDASMAADLVVCAWGAYAGSSWAKRKGLTTRGNAVRRLLDSMRREPHVLRYTKSGEPGHPLYLKADLRPFPMETSR